MPTEISKVEAVLPGIIVSVVALGFMKYLESKVMAARTGKDLMKSKKIGGKLDLLAGQIQEGARAFLMEEYKWLGYFVCVMAIILLILFSVSPSDGADSSQVRCKINLLRRFFSSWFNGPLNKAPCRGAPARMCLVPASLGRVSGPNESLVPGAIQHNDFS